MISNFLHKRQPSGTWYFIYKEPQKDGCALVPKQKWISLRTKCAKEALVKAAPLIDLYVLNRTATELPESVAAQYDTAKSICEAREIDYRPITEVQALPLDQFIAHASSVVSVHSSLKNPSRAEMIALSGAAPVPALTFGKAFERFKELRPEKVKNKTADQADQKWKRFWRACRDFVAHMGDRDILTLTTKDVEEYRVLLTKRSMAGEFKSHEASLRLKLIDLVLRPVLRTDYPGHDNPFEDVDHIDLDDDGKRESFTEAEVRHVLAKLKDSQMSDEAKAIIRIGNWTGANAKELANLLEADINLTSNVPYIAIRTNEVQKGLKTKSRVRKIPLCGDALEEFRRYPKGFIRYSSNEKGVTRLNRHLSDFFKKTIPGKGFYCFRHSMAERLRNADIDLGLKGSIGGWSVKGHVEYYGKTYTLPAKQAAILKAMSEGARAKEQEEIDNPT